MEQLLAKAKINEPALKREIVKVVSKNLGGLSEPCYYPEVKKHLYDFLKLSGLTEKDIKDFTKRRWKGRKEATYAIHNDHIANFYIFLMQYFLKKRDKTTYGYLMVFFIIRYYANLMYKSFTYCNPDVFKYALEVLTKTHLFAREKTIGNALYFISKDMVRRWTKGLRNNDLDAISKFMQDSRSRVSQSMKSFAQTYYRASEEGAGIQSGVDDDSEDDENSYQIKAAEKGEKIADEITKNITVYRLTDYKSQEAARKLAKMNASLATQIISKLNNTKYSDNLRIIFKLFLKDIPDAQSLCGNKYEGYVRQLMSIKRTRNKIYFKQQVNILLIKILEEIDYDKKYNEYTSQTQFLINLFLAYYLTMILKLNLC
jgi:hypothetical protein